jgi:hypothetical protein
VKLQLLLVTGLLVLGIGCIDTAPQLINDFVPVRGRATGDLGEGTLPLEQRIITAISYDGRTYIQNDSWICDQCHTPDVVVKNGVIYLYYTGWTVGDRVHTTALAISSDQGQTWIYKYVELVGNDISERFFSPDVILLDDGSFRLFFTGGQPRSIHFADSTDGITFTYKGALFSPQGDVAIDSTTFRVGDTWHMYALSDEGVNRIWHLTSQDATTFSVYGLTSFPIDGEPLLPSDGLWVDDRFFLFLSGMNETLESMWTKNGLDWYPSDDPSLRSEDGQDIQDPTVADLGNGHSLMFFVSSIP